MTVARQLSRSLSAYLCGTHSGALASRRRERLGLDEIARGHRGLAPPGGETRVRLGDRPWQPAEDARDLAQALRSSLDGDPVIDLVVFGSHARGSTTGFSDLDAILVIADEAADDPSVLRALRRRVLAAQRAAIAHQPMQHHAFEVATPRLLSRANEALGMPAVAFSETGSLRGRGFDAAFTPDPPDETRARLAALVSHTTSAPAWPSHPWRLHGLVSMFELLPALYLQALGRDVPKWRSFVEAREHFGDAWWPYDVLERVRDAWQRSSSPALRGTISALRNPWLCVAIWSRLPAVRRQPARSMLSSECLEALRSLAREMGGRAC